MANGNKLIDQKAIDTIIDSILKAVEIKLNKKSSEGRGKDGKDGRDGKNAPQINDDEALSTNPWSGLKTQEEIAKVEGKIYTCTAQALEEMSQEQQAELYVQGYRAIKTENNGTVVLLGLSADGSLEWLGCNQPRGNLLDNPNFAIAQAGYGGMHGTQKYAADRWILVNGEINHDGTNVIIGGVIAQRIAASADLEGKEITYVVYPQSGEPAVLTTKLEKGMSTITSSTSLLTIAVYQEGDLFVANINAQGVQCAIKGTGLFIGSYTPKTLPPWEKPDYTVEIIKCQYFYRRDRVSFQAAVPNSGIPGFSYPRPMRVAPTINIYNEYGDAGYISSWGVSKAFKVVSTPVTQEGLYFIKTEPVPQTVVSCMYLIESIADL